MDRGQSEDLQGGEIEVIRGQGVGSVDEAAGYVPDVGGGIAGGGAADVPKVLDAAEPGGGEN